MRIFKPLLFTSLFLVLVFGAGYAMRPSFAFAQSNGNIGTLDQWTSTTSPVVAITQKTFGKTIKITGLSDGCLGLIGNLLVSSGSACGSGSGSGSGNVATSSSETSGRIPFWTSTAGSPAFLSGGISGFTTDGTKVSITNASTTNLTIGSLTGFLKATAGAVSTALINLTSDVTGILPIANGGTATSTAPTLGQILIGNGAGGYAFIASSTLGGGGSGSGTVGAGTTGQFPYYAANGTTLTATSTLFLDTTGNVGIGSTTPTAKLSIHTNAGGTGTLPLFNIASSTAAGTATTTLFTVLGNGNTGIGTTTPSSLFSIAGSNAILGINATGINDTIGINMNAFNGGGTKGFFTTNMNSGEVRIGGGSGSFFPTFYSNGSETMRITTAGFVGIGTTTPGAKLHVVGGDIALDTARFLYVPGNGTINIGDGGDNINIANSGIYATANAGNVGIGSTSPAAKLTVKGAGTTTGLNFQTTNSSNVPLITALDNGNVGIGVSPTGRLTVKASTADSSATDFSIVDSGGASIFSIRNDQKFDFGSGSQNTQLTISGSGASSGIYSPAYSSGSTNIIKYKDFNGNIRMTLDMSSTVNGKLGVGSTTPLSTLSVTGFGTTDPFTIASSSGLSMFGINRFGAETHNNDAGTAGYVLQSFGASAPPQWVATSTLGFTGGGGAGTVTSVGLTAPTGLSVSGSPVTTSGTLALSLTAGYVIPLTASTTNWESFYNTPSTRITAGSGLGWSGNTLSISPSADVAWNGYKITGLADPVSAQDAATKAYVDTAVTGLLDYRGGYDASSNLYPSTGGSGLLGAVVKGDFWIVTTPGTLGGTAVANGDLVIALVDTPGQTAGNWDLLEHDLGYAPVQSISIASANGFAGSSSGGITPALTISTSITGLLKGNGTAISAAAAGTDYEVPLTFSTGLTRTVNTVTVNTSQNIATLSNLTSNGLVTTSGGTGALSVTVPGTGWLTTIGSNVGASSTVLTSNGTSAVWAAPTSSNFFSNTGIYTSLSTGTNLGIGTSSPLANLSVLDLSTTINPFAIFTAGYTASTTTFTNSGTYTIPSGAVSLTVAVVGGGGGGGASTGAFSNGGGGGGSSAFADLVIGIGGDGGNSVPGKGAGAATSTFSVASLGATTTASIIVGQGGGSSNNGGSGGTGGTGYFPGTNGSTGGAGAGVGGGSTGSGTGPSVGDKVTTGGNPIGNTGGVSGSGAAGGTGGASPTNGSNYGAGGGALTTGSNFPGAGGPGVVIVTAYIPNAASTTPLIMALSTGGNLGIAIGTSTTQAMLTVVTPVQQAVTYFAGIIANIKYVFESIDQYGHLRTGGPAPTVATCTGFSIAGDDRSGVVTMTSGTTCSFNFANAYPVQPACAINPETSASTVRAVTSATQVAVTFGTAQTSFSYTCQYHQ